MSFERNDVVFKNRLAEALEENTMGFEHNDIVTVDKMNAAIAGGGGDNGLTTASVTFIVEENTSGTFNAPFIYIDTDDGVRYIDSIAPLDAITDGTYEVILVDGTYVFDVNAGGQTGFSITGSAERTSGGITVTGDCTVSLVVQK